MSQVGLHRKQALVLAGLVILLTVISFLLFYYGRQHRIILDNRSVELGGQNYRALAGVLVAVNHPTLDRDSTLAAAASPGRGVSLSFNFWPKADFSIIKAVEMMPRERILVKVVGPKFNLKAEVYDRAGESLGTIDTDIHLGTRRNAMIRLVKLHNDLPEVMEDYPEQATRPPADEEPAPAGGGEGLMIGEEISTDSGLTGP
jgi:hypothetical protein